MKKRSFLLTMIAVIFVFSFPLSSCGKKSLTMPEGTNLEFWVTYDIAGVDLTEYARADDESGAEAFAIYGHGYEPVKNDDGTVTDPDVYVKYRITPWPTFASGGTYVTAVTWNDPEVNLYGINVASSFDDVEAALKDAGYKVSRMELTSHASLVAKKDGATVTLDDSDGARTFTVSVDVVDYGRYR